MADTKRVVQAIEPSWRQDAVIDGRYRLNSLIGRGGFAEVWRAQCVSSPHRTVAIKRLLQATASEQMRRRFRYEIKALKLLGRHQNVVTGYGCGEHLGQDYLVLEYVAGRTLQSWLELQRQGQKAGWPLPALFPTLDLIDQICNALQAAHRHKIVHRDLKPDNIMLLPLGADEWQVKVLDFGVARIGKRVDTLTGDRLGTYGYMSPEQMSEGLAEVGPASDVFSIGVLCVELLTLTAHSPGGAPYAYFVDQHWDQLLRCLQATRRDVPTQIWSAIARSLHPRVTGRYPNAEALWSALHDAASSLRKAS